MECGLSQNIPMYGPDIENLNRFYVVRYVEFYIMLLMVATTIM